MKEITIKIIILKNYNSRQAEGSSKRHRRLGLRSARAMTAALTNATVIAITNEETTPATSLVSKFLSLERLYKHNFASS